jgi:hypothetical protein
MAQQDDTVQIINRLTDWVTFYQVKIALGLSKQGVHRLIFDSGLFNVDTDVCAVQVSAARFVYLLRPAALRKEINRRAAAGIPHPTPTGDTAE